MHTRVMPCSPVLVAIILSGLTPHRIAGQDTPARAARPPVPYITHGACPFECCTYRDWVAEEVIPVRTKPVKRSSVAFYTRKGERITGDSGHVVVSRPGVVVASATFVLSGHGDTVTTVQPRDTVYLLDYTGEGVWHVWYRGRTHELDQDWNDPSFPGSRRGPPATMKRIAAPESEWWAHITRRSGAGGWILMDSARVGNVDACG